MRAALPVLFSLVWSSAFVAGKIGVARMDPATLLSLRFALSALLLAPFALRAAAPMGLALGALNNAAYLGLTFWALTRTSAVVVVALVSCAPFVTAGLATLFGVERPAPRFYLGAAIGLAGVLTVIGLDPAGATLAGVALSAGGVIAFSLGTLLYRARAQTFDAKALTFWQSASGAALLAPVAWFEGSGFERFDLVAAGALVYLAVVATIGGMILWFALIAQVGAARASAAHLMNPFFGAALSSIALGTPLRIADFIGAAVIALGLAVAVRVSTADRPR